jgi:hypothetical protein
MKIINEYLILHPITGYVEKYVELEGDVFFKQGDENRYYWVNPDVFYELYEESKKTFEEWKETIK